MHFDDARKLAQSAGIDLTKEWNKGFIVKEKEYIKILGPHERDTEGMKNSTELIDVLHHAVILWSQGKHKNLKKLLQETGYGTKDVFFRVAQAISETLPVDSKEKRLLDGFLSGRDRILSKIQEDIQGRLFE